MSEKAYFIEQLKININHVRKSSIWLFTNMC